ncbi:hypothetical protein INS49_007876 [Diaporthe citri]|uniref:uncharacterized protein n=1 Tax=Diaporthe citri TaxID=83186 RepID=UPI001C819B13|nr:uncharacterized protein INS49_007876 [Diaporthe citri]KAG6362782.1 hypothetical protein INS49_007876 [Diaporthe citri]
MQLRAMSLAKSENLPLEFFWVGYPEAVGCRRLPVRMQASTVGSGKQVSVPVLTLDIRRQCYSYLSQQVSADRPHPLQQPDWWYCMSLVTPASPSI